MSPTVEQLRAAVSAGAYAQAETLLGVYREEMQASWEKAATPEQRTAIASQVKELLEWARISTLAARAHSQSKLIYLSRRNAYAADSR